MAVEFRILGPLEVWRDGTQVELGAAKQRALLTLLLIRRGEVGRDLLVDALWGEQPPKWARNTLQVYVSSLRRALGREVIETASGGYALRLEPGSLDVERFECLFREGKDALASDSTAAAATLREALALWRGAALADFRYEAFARAEAGRLDELRLVCIEERIEADLQLARHAEVVGELEALIVEHPLRERLRAQLILALYRSGRQSDALAQYQATRRMLADELGLEPSPELRELERLILRHDPTLAAPRPRSRSNLPAQPTPFIGREKELAQVTELVRTGSRRLLTLTGGGGSGKTRLAIEAAAQLGDHFPEGVYWVPLQSLRDPKLVLPTIAGVVDAKGDLSRHIGDRPLLLLIDNCEHLPEAARDLASLLSSCPNLVLLTTSREPLHLAAERQYPVEPMSEADAVSLFCERAYRCDRIEVVAAICKKLDRLPLAIELGAAKTKTLDLDEVLEGIDHRLEFLQGGPRDAPERQQTLRATIEWSYDLLSPEEQRVYRAFAVFRGGCVPAAAQEVSGTNRGLLDGLYEKHLLKLADGRYTMLETLREHALERLEELDEASAMRSAHSGWYLGFAEEFAAEVPNAMGAKLETYQRWIPVVESDLDNFRAAMRWSIDNDEREHALRIANGLASYWARGGGSGLEGAFWLSGALDACGPMLESTEARSQYLLGMWLIFAGRPSEGEEPLRRSLALYRSAGDNDRQFHVFRGLASAAFEQGDLERARELWGEAGRLDSNDLEWAIDQGLGLIEVESGNLGRAREFFESGLRRAEELDRPRTVGAFVTYLADLDLLEGSFDRADRGFRASLQIWRSYVYDAAIAESMAGLAVTCAMRGQLERSGRLWGAVQVLEELGVRYERPRMKRYGAIMKSRAEPDFLDALGVGRRLSLDQAVAYALDESA